MKITVALVACCLAEVSVGFVFKPPCEIQQHTCYDMSECPPGTQPLASLCLNDSLCCVGTPTPPPCGILVTPRVLNGDPDSAVENPWLVKVIDNGTGELVCGGVLIDMAWIAFDAYCATSCEKAGGCRVLMGNYDAAVEEPQEQQRNLAAVHLHPDVLFKTADQYDTFFNTNPEAVLINNVAIAQLSAPITPSDRINRVCPPSDVYNVFRSPRNCKVAGFGYTDQAETTNPQVSGVRQVVDAVIIDDRTCEHIRGTPQPPTTHCGVLTKTDTGICRGDNGGALVCQNDTSSFWTAEGIVSHYTNGNGACSDQLFIFTDIYGAWDWIQDTINGV
ncbi:chymotrypsinogen A-like [Haliotis cracherodii]|uniref:chymotrypsinogen A-like n=1 Tax=Haliotis cracherodii TaxID=6455 RepID=UPI0039E7551F